MMTFRDKMLATLGGQPTDCLPCNLALYLNNVQ